LAGGSVFVVLPVVQNNLPFDVNEFVPIGFVAEQPYTLLTTNKLGVIRWPTGRVVQEQPGGLDSVAGTRGGLQHLTVEWFRNRSGANLNMIHYPGAAQASNDVIAGRVPMMMQTIAPVAGIVAAARSSCWRSHQRLGCRTIPIRRRWRKPFRGSPRRAGRSWWRRRHTTGRCAKNQRRSANGAGAPGADQENRGAWQLHPSHDPTELSDFVRTEREIWQPIVKQIGIAQ